jgi:hypothetical protein
MLLLRQAPSRAACPSAVPSRLVHSLCPFSGSRPIDQADSSTVTGAGICVANDRSIGTGNIPSMGFENGDAAGHGSTSTDMHGACIAVTDSAVNDAGNGISGADNGVVTGRGSSAGGWISGNNNDTDTHGACINIKRGQDVSTGTNNSSIAPDSTGIGLAPVSHSAEKGQAFLIGMDGAPNRVVAAETNPVTLTTDGDSVGIAVAALGIPIGEETQATLTDVGENDQVAWSDATKSTPRTEGVTLPWNDPASQVPADMGSIPLLKAPVIAPGVAVGRAVSLDQCNCGRPQLDCAAPTKPLFGTASQFKAPKNFKHTLCLDKQSECRTSNEWGVSSL